MSYVLRLSALAFGALLLASCATTDPYAAAYDSCDQEAGACYADCRTLEDEERREACQQRCTTSVNRCFAQTREAATRRARYRAAPDVVFYGRYGAYDPYLGYRYGRHGRRYSYGAYRYDRFGYDRYGYDRYGYDRRGYGYHGQRRRSGPVFGLGSITRNGSGRDEPTTTAPTAPSGDDRYVTEDGSVFTADGRRLRYGGQPETQPRARPRSGGVRPTSRTLDPSGKPSGSAAPIARPRTPRTVSKAPTTRPSAKPRTRARTAPKARPRAAPRARSRSGEPKRVEP